MAAAAAMLFARTTRTLFDDRDSRRRETKPLLSRQITRRVGGGGAVGRVNA